MRFSNLARLFAGAAVLLAMLALHPAPASAAGQGAQTHSAQASGGKGADDKSGQAAGNGSTGSGKAEGILVAEVILLLVVGRILGEALQRVGQPALMGQLLAGIILGPSLLGWVWPQAQHFLFPTDGAQKGMIDGLSQIGILFLLLLTGMETDLRLVRKVKGAAIGVSVMGVAVPFLGGFALGQFLPDSILPAAAGGKLVPSLFLGTALSISSVKIVAMVVREMNFMRRNLGQVIVASAIIEDTIGWVIMAITFGIAGQKNFDIFTVARTVAGIAIFLVFSFTIGRRIVFTVIRWTNDNFRSEFPVITAILVIMGTMALMTQLLGVRTVLGAFVAGVLIGESPILTAHIQSQLRGMIAAFFMPVFFGMSGLSADLTVLKDWHLLLLTIALVGIASLGKFGGALSGAKLGGLSWKEGTALGCAMNARGSTEVVVASIGLSIGALSQNLYTMIVTMAMITTLAMPPMLRAALARVPMRKDEKTRIEREEMDEKGFLPGLERLLLAVDESPVGKFAARFAGLVAGARGMPVTIVNVDQGHIKAASGERQEPLQSVSQEVKTGAKASAAKMLADDAEPDPEKVHLTERTRKPTQKPETVGDMVAAESRKGYDLLFIGLEKSHDKDGVFSRPITDIAREFDGNIAILAHDGKIEDIGPASKLLVAVNGAEASRRAAEIAFAAARATGADVTAIYISQGDMKVRTRRREEEVIKDITKLAERYNVEVKSRIAARGDAGDVILTEALRGNYDLVVLGVSMRPGDDLFFGNTATKVLVDWKKQVLFLASKPAEAKKYEPGDSKDA